MPRASWKNRTRGWWLRQLHTWHWMSSGLSLACMIFFALTGLTLNHAASISGSPATVRKTARLAAADRSLLRDAPAPDAKRALPPALRAATERALGLFVPARAAEWSPDAIDLDLAGPGADGTLSIDRASGAIDYERTDHGWIAWVNDLHKGRNTGGLWFWFIDLFAFGVLVFALTGLCLLQLHARHRRKTWPIVGFGLALPVLLLLVFVHG